LRDANLRGADLQDANLRGADLRGADLRGANLHRVHNKIIIRCGGIGSEKRDTYFLYDDKIIICGFFCGSVLSFYRKVSEEYEKKELPYLQYIESIHYFITQARILRKNDK
jgi:hypothetical protein